MPSKIISTDIARRIIPINLVMITRIVALSTLPKNEAK